MGQLSPLAPRIYQIQHCIRQFPFAPRAVSHSLVQWGYLFPLLICQVAGIRLSSFFFHVSILPLSFAFVNTASKKLAKYSGIIWQKDLCLKPDALVQYVRTQPGFHNWTRNRIIQELKDIGALVLQEENASTVHIDKDLPRVYRIRLDVLKDMAEYY